MQRVLFLCTGNSARSQMAEATLKMIGDKRFEVFSAGTSIASEVNPFALEILQERGVNVEGLHPKKVDSFLELSFDIVITVCDNAKQTCPVFPGVNETLHWSLEDPAAVQGSDEEIRNEFRKTRDTIEKLIREHLIEKV